MSRNRLSEMADLPVAAPFTTLDTVTITVIDLMTSLSEPIDSAVCTEIGTTGQFRWSFADLTTQPTEFKRFLWTMTNSSIEYSDIVDCGGWVEDISVVNNIIEYPSITLESRDVIIGDSWAPRFEVKSTDANLKIQITIEDGGGNILSKATENVAGGSDAQINKIADGDTFQIYRFYVSDIESAAFTGGFDLKINISVQLSDDTVFSVEQYTVPLSSTTAITFDSI